MKKTVRKRVVKTIGILCSLFLIVCMVCPVNAQVPAEVDPKPKTYMPVVIEEDFDTTMKQDVKDKPNVMERQKKLLERRYDLGDRPADVMMSGGRKPIQKGVRVKLSGDDLG